MITQKDIYQLFRELLEQIQDVELRDTVTVAWTKAAQQGQWKNISELHKMPFTLLTNTHGVNFVEHTIAVTKGAVALAKAQQSTYDEMPYEINMDWLIAGVLLHDVGKLLEFEKTTAGGYRKSFNGKCTRHPISGAILAAGLGLPLEIINMIGCHAKEGDGRPQRIETVLIHQADFATFNPMVMLEKGTLIV